MQHPPVVSKVENEWKIIPMSPLTDHSKDWKDVLSFDPVQHFGEVSVEDSYFIKVWARDNSPFPKIELLMDSANSSRRLPHSAYIDFKKTPMYVVPNTLLLSWLSLGFSVRVPHHEWVRKARE